MLSGGVSLLIEDPWQSFIVSRRFLINWRRVLLELWARDLLWTGWGVCSSLVGDLWWCGSLGDVCSSIGDLWWTGGDELRCFSILLLLPPNLSQVLLGRRSRFTEEKRSGQLKKKCRIMEISVTSNMIPVDPQTYNMYMVNLSLICFCNFLNLCKWASC